MEKKRFALYVVQDIYMEIKAIRLLHVIIPSVHFTFLFIRKKWRIISKNFVGISKKRYKNIHDYKHPSGCFFNAMKIYEKIRNTL